MTIEILHNIFQWFAIAAALLTAFYTIKTWYSGRLMSKIQVIAVVLTACSTIGSWYTGRLLSINQKKEIANLQQKIQTVEIQTRETKFRASNFKVEKKDDGKFDYIFTLTPEGSRVVPILIVGAKPASGTGSVHKISIDGHILLGMVEILDKPDDPAWQGVRYTNVMPQILTVKVLYSSDPRIHPLKIDIEPLSE